ncbi:MAG: hypothetical protein JWO05_1313 [Gemmatimonadetes bacterium]|nr:hypothetical protein [Gemmatimonadota bacterium]
MTELSVRPVAPVDIDAIAAVHLRAFSDSALTSLGAEAVRRYYRSLLAPPHDAVAIVAFQSEQLVGFSFGGLLRRPVARFVQDNRFFLATRLLARPWLLVGRVMRSRTSLGARLLMHAPPAPAANPSTRSFAILSIATDPAFIRRGVGSALLARMVAEAKARGFGQMHLTVHKSNAAAIAFYEREGWARHEGPEGWDGRMVRSVA